MYPQLTDDEIAGLAEIERDMDDGKQSFVVNRGNRWAFPAEVLEPLKIESGQTVSDQLLISIMKHNIANLQTKIAITKMENFK